ncbi:MAG: phage holin family protein [Eubacteriales bacterium]
MDLNEYISPSLLTLLPVLYMLGGALKKSPIKDWAIPFILGGAGIVLSCAWLFAEGLPRCFIECAEKIFMGITQGVIIASVTVYAHNLVKQYKKKNENGSGTQYDNENDNDRIF